jgi:tetratricopeptide (TPR) repeat protein
VSDDSAAAATDAVATYLEWPDVVRFVDTEPLEQVVELTIGLAAQTDLALAIVDHGLRRFGPQSSLVELRAQLLLHDERPYQALDAALWCLELSPDSAEALRVKVVAQLSTRQYRAMLETLDVMIERGLVDGNDSEVFDLRVRSLIALEDLETADAVVGAWMAEHPDDPKALAAEARRLQRVDEPKRALELLDRLVELMPGDASVLEQRSGVHIDAQNYELALADADAVLAINPDSYAALAHKGEALRMCGRSEEAEPVLRLALTHDPSNAWARGTLGQVVLANGRADEALDVLDQALADDPSMNWARASRAEALRSLGRYEEAIEEADRAGPDQRAGMSAKAESLRLLGRYREALDVLDDALARLAPTAFLVGTRGQVLTSLERYDEAVAELRAATSLPGGDAVWIRSSLADALRMVGEYDEALAVADAVIAEQPDDRSTLAGRAETLRMLGRLDESIAAADALLRVDPQDWWLAGCRARALFDAGRFAEALAAAQDVLSINPDTEFSLLTAVMAHNQLDESTAALDAARRLRTIAGADDAVGAEQEALSPLLLGRPGEAFDAAATVPASTASLHYYRGAALVRLGRLAEAEVELRAAIAAEESPWSLAELSDCLELGVVRAGRARASVTEAADLARRAIEIAESGSYGADAFVPAAWCLLKMGDGEGGLRYLKLAPSDLTTRFSTLMAQLIGTPHLPIDDALTRWIEDLRRHPDAGRRWGILDEARYSIALAGELGFATTDQLTVLRRRLDTDTRELP